VADALGDVAEVEKILSSRLVRHTTLASLAGTEWPLIVGEIQQLKARGEPQIVRLADEVRHRYGELAPEEEVKEILTVAVEMRMAEGPIAGLLRRLREAVASTLRRMGFKHRFDTVDLDAVITAAEKEMQSGEKESIAHGSEIPGFAVVTDFPESDVGTSLSDAAQNQQRETTLKEGAMTGLQL